MSAQMTDFSTSQTVPARISANGIPHQQLSTKNWERRDRLFTFALGRANRRYNGTITIDEAAGRLPDSRRLGDIQNQLLRGEAITYWTDGGWFPHLDLLVAGVVTMKGSGLSYTSKEYALCSGGGESGDAEVFAVAEALAEARRTVVGEEVDVSSAVKLETVRVFTDCQGVLRALQGRYCFALGPLGRDDRLAIRGIYDDTDWLVGHGVRVELAWVKGHLPGGSEGNDLADKACRSAKDKIRGALPPPPTVVPEVPDMYLPVREDWRNEWSWRADRTFFTIVRPGAVGPQTAPPDEVEEEEEQEEDEEERAAREMEEMMGFSAFGRR